MSDTLPGMMIDTSERQAQNAPDRISVTPLGMVIEVRLSHESNADFSIIVKLSDSFIVFKALQLKKALSPINETLSGMMIDANEEQLLNA